MKLQKKFGDNYAVWSDILGKIGWAYRKEYTKININLTNMSQKNGQIINSTCKELYNQTLFSRYFYQKQEKIISLGLQNATAIKHFFNGGWLEWHALGIILEEVKQCGKDYTFSCARNINMKFDNGDLHEIDVMLLPKEQDPIVIECKSGEFRREIEKYVKLNKRLELPSGHFMILAAEIDSDQSAALSSMYGLSFVSLENLKQSLRQIIQSTLKEN